MSVIVGVALALAAVSCGSDSATSATADPAKAVSSTIPEPPPDPEYRRWIATVKETVPEVTILDAPAGEPLQLDMSETGVPETVVLANKNDNDVDMTFLVKERFVESDGIAWHEVYLPVRPNGSTGWVKAADVEMAYTDLAIAIELGARTLTVSNQGEPIGSFTVAIGEPGTPTPTGYFFVKELLAPADPDGAYGPLAYGLSGHSDEINNEQFPDGVIGIHGTNQPELIGGEVSHGCVRMTNEDITAVAAMALPLGTPVTISD